MIFWYMGSWEGMEMGGLLKLVAIISLLYLCLCLVAIISLLGLCLCLCDYLSSWGFVLVPVGVVVLAGMIVFLEEIADS